MVGPTLLLQVTGYTRGYQAPADCRTRSRWSKFRKDSDHGRLRDQREVTSAVSRKQRLAKKAGASSQIRRRSKLIESIGIQELPPGKGFSRDLGQLRFVADLLPVAGNGVDCAVHDCARLSPPLVKRRLGNPFRLRQLPNGHVVRRQHPLQHCRLAFQ